MSDLQANHDEFTELMKEQKNLEDPDRLREIRLRMTELNHQYFASPPLFTPRQKMEVPAHS